MKDANWEIASHGLKWIEYKDMSADLEARDMAEAVRLHTEVTGSRPQGWYTGRCSENTVRLVAEHGGFDYVSDTYADDLPYWEKFGERDQLIIPYTLDANDMRFATPQGFNSGDQFETYLKDSFDALYAEGQADVPKMLSIGLHCRLIGRPGRVMALKRFIEYAQSHADVWFARRIDIARHWAATHPAPAPRVRPSLLDRANFVATYGSIIEHSPWVADRAFDLELGPAHDTAVGLQSALARVFRSATPTERLGVLNAHPDLAGKLAAAKRLTGESTSEQASAGLDAMTEIEHATFTQLNNAYTAKHGFPFIIAVRDYTKTTILTTFERRIYNDTATEFAEACRQVERIARLRLDAILP
jgi:OHCU decarboxylase